MSSVANILSSLFPNVAVVAEANTNILILRGNSEPLKEIQEIIGELENVALHLRSEIEDESANSNQTPGSVLPPSQEGKDGQEKIKTRR